MQEKFALSLMRASIPYALFASGRGWGNIWLSAREAGFPWTRTGRCWLGCALLCFSLSSAAQSQGSREDQLEAEFIYKVAEFTTWPQGAFANSNSPLVIDVLGDDPLGHALDKTVRGETAGGRRLIVEWYGRAEEVKTCHILFISQSEIRQLDEIVKRLKGKPILTITDAHGPAFAGVMIRFTIERHELDFHINQQATKAAELTLSSRLLRMADALPPAKKL